MIGPNDVDLFTDAIFERNEAETGDNEQHQSNGSTREKSPRGAATGDEGVANDKAVLPNADASANGTSGQVEDAEHTEPSGGEVSRLKETEPTPKVNGLAASTEKSSATAPLETPVTANNAQSGEGAENGGDVEMRQDEPGEQQDAAANSATAKEDQAASEPDDRFIHPIFLPPANAHPDKGGLSESEAEEMRRLVALYVQKQEEVCRGAHKLHEGLLRAERLRQTVLKWSKFEAHAGPNRDLSDGEDWYDKEEWGLTEDLKKGQDEEEEDNTATATKKTRNRR
jgi:hypothetical protein